eukprot:COSAG05_NODE_185_length_14731_cov_30.866389_3_plen_190_part_00
MTVVYWMTCAAVECTFMNGNNAYTLPHLYSDTQQLRLLRDMLLFEEVNQSVSFRGQTGFSGNLSIGWGVPTHWVATAEPGLVVSLSQAPTIFGKVSFTLGRIETDNNSVAVLQANITVDAPTPNNTFRSDRYAVHVTLCQPGCVCNAIVTRAHCVVCSVPPRPPLRSPPSRLLCSMFGFDSVLPRRGGR